MLFKYIIREITELVGIVTIITLIWQILEILIIKDINPNTFDSAVAILLTLLLHHGYKKHIRS